jgi:hypothetical protein
MRNVPDKYRELAGPVLGKEQAEVLLERLWSLEHAADLNLAGKGACQ